MIRRIDLTGLVFGRWTVLGYAGQSKWNCRCECGIDRPVFGDALRRGTSVSCGCFSVELLRSRRTRHGACVAEPHGNHLYRVWRNMKQRCYSPGSKSFKDYGARGIVVCAEWKDDFAAFERWAVANGFSADLELDRRDNSGPYSPENCRFVTKSQNLRNTRQNRLLTAFNETKTMAAWLDDPRCVVDRATLNTRIRRGWNEHNAITTPAPATRMEARDAAR